MLALSSFSAYWDGLEIYENYGTVQNKQCDEGLFTQGSEAVRTNTTTTKRPNNVPRNKQYKWKTQHTQNSLLKGNFFVLKGFLYEKKKTKKIPHCSLIVCCCIKITKIMLFSLNKGCLLVSMRTIRTTASQPTAECAVGWFDEVALLWCFQLSYVGFSSGLTTCGAVVWRNSLAVWIKMKENLKKKIFL